MLLFKMITGEYPFKPFSERKLFTDIVFKPVILDTDTMKIKLENIDMYDFVCLALDKD